MGYWPDGVQTDEPGRRMALLHGETLDLEPGQRLLDCGSGLGQGTIDLARRFGLAKVFGINPSRQQVAFARRLVDAHGLSDQIDFVEDDACQVVPKLPEGSYDHAMAVECFSYFPDKLEFLKGLMRTLRSGGKFVFADACSATYLSKRRRRALGFVSNATSHPVSYFVDLFERAGFVDIRHTDITERVVAPSIAHARARLADEPERLRKHGWLMSRVLHALVDHSERTVSRRESTYDLLVATVP